MKIYIYLFLAILLLSPAYAQIYISEINFLDEEFVEIYSDDILNLSGKIIYDGNGIEYANNLTLVENKNSSYYLIVGSNFIKNNNLSNLNCSIYDTKRTGPGYDGLNKDGENITIQIGEDTYIAWEKDQSYTFEENQTLNYNSTSTSYYKELKSACLGPIFEDILNETINESQNNENITPDSCNYNFEITPTSNFFTDKLQFDFTTNATNFTIEYWIEDYSGTIYKNKYNTTNTNTKSYTPKYSNTFNIKANLYVQNCTLNDTKTVHFYSENEYKETTSSTSTQTEQTGNPTSYIQILNEDKFETFQTNLLEYEIYRGDINKRVVNIYLNNEKIGSIEVDKYSSTKNKIKLELSEGINSILFIGLDIEKEFMIYKQPKEQINELQKETTQSDSKTIFEITNFDLEDNSIYFDLNSNYQNHSILCYVTYIRTKMSEELNLTTQSNLKDLRLQINSQKLLEKEELNTYPLKLTCKAQKFNTTYYKYANLEFNYTISNKIEKIEISNNYYSIQDETPPNIKTLEKEIKTLFSPQITSEKGMVNYTSEGIKTKENSLFSMLIGTSMLIGAFVLSW